jgi:uncharacterized protein YhdP
MPSTAGRIELRGVNMSRGGSQVDLVRARLTRLQLPKQEATRSAQLIDPTADRRHQPAAGAGHRGGRLRAARQAHGRLEVQAQVPAGAREWKLDKLLLSSPDATLSASGRWGATPGAPHRAGLEAGRGGRRQADGAPGPGPGLARRQGPAARRAGWTGSPLARTTSACPAAEPQLDTGTFLKAEPGVAGCWAC